MCERSFSDLWRVRQLATADQGAEFVTNALAACRLCCDLYRADKVQGTSAKWGKKCASNALAVYRLRCGPWTDKKRGAAFNQSGWGIELCSYTGSVVVVDLCSFKKWGAVALYTESREPREYVTYWLTIALDILVVRNWCVQKKKHHKSLERNYHKTRDTKG